MRFDKDNIRGICIRQPYAALIMPPHNKIETRTWTTLYRGPLLLIASKIGFTTREIMEISGPEMGRKIVGMLQDPKFSMPEGVAYAIAELVDVRKMKPEDEQSAYVKYNPSLYCHIYHYVEPINRFYVRGQVGLMKLREEQVAQIIKPIPSTI